MLSFRYLLRISFRGSIHICVPELIRCTHRFAKVSLNCVTQLPVKVATASDENHRWYGPWERTVEQRGLANFRSHRFSWLVCRYMHSVHSLHCVRIFPKFFWRFFFSVNLGEWVCVYFSMRKEQKYAMFKSTLITLRVWLCGNCIQRPK